MKHCADRYCHCYFKSKGKDRRIVYDACVASKKTSVSSSAARNRENWKESTSLVQQLPHSKNELHKQVQLANLVLVLHQLQILLDYQNSTMADIFKQVILLWIIFDCGFSASVITCDDFYGNSISILSEDSDVSANARRCCTSGFKNYVVVGGPLRMCSDQYDQRNDTIWCASQIPNSLTGVSGILNCCPDATKSFYLGSEIYPCTTHLVFPAVTAHALLKYCPSGSLLQSENLPAIKNPNNGGLIIKLHFFWLVFAFTITGIVIFT